MALIVAVFTLAACLPAADAPIPLGYDAVVESARSSVLGNFEGFVRPALAVTSVRCFANGGVIVMFRQVGGPTPGKPAFAMSGGGGPAPDMSSWSGGSGDMEDIQEEIDFNFAGIAEVPCLPRGP
jgi:hypothetical protein